MTSLRQILPTIAKKHKKHDIRVINTIMRSPFNFLYQKIEEYDNRAIRFPYWGIYYLKPKYRKDITESTTNDTK